MCATNSPERFARLEREAATLTPREGCGMGSLEYVIWTCVYVNVCIYMYVYMYINACIYVNTCVYVCTHVYTYI